MALQIRTASMLSPRLSPGPRPNLPSGGLVPQSIFGTYPDPAIERSAHTRRFSHYYFPTKAELCRALIARQRAEVKARLDQIDSDDRDAKQKLARYVAVFRATLEVGDLMCLCGTLATDLSTLDPSVAMDLRGSFEDHEGWLRGVLEKGKKSGSLRFDASPRDEARLLLSSLEGAMLIARTFKDLRRFEITARNLLAKLNP